ncbi:MAG: hypothetical protein ACYDEZ_09000, partial [Methanoregula sp.]
MTKTGTNCNGCESDTCAEICLEWQQQHDAQVASDAVKQALAPLKAVYEKFDHLDVCLSDPEWCQSGEGAAIYGIAGEM